MDIAGRIEGFYKADAVRLAYLCTIRCISDLVNLPVHANRTDCPLFDVLRISEHLKQPGQVGQVESRLHRQRRHSRPWW